MELCVYFSFFILGFCLVSVCAVHVQPQVVWVHTCTSLIVSGKHCLEHLSSLVLTMFSPFFHVDTQVLREGFDKGISFRAECSKVSHSSHTVQLWTSALSTIYCKRSSFDEAWEMLFSIGYRNMSLVVTFIMFLLQDNSSRFSSRPMTYLAPCSLTFYHCYVWVPFHWMDLKYNQRVRFLAILVASVPRLY